MKKTNDTFERIKQVIDDHDNLLVLSHVSPDGDNIGSVIALTLALEKAGKRVTAVTNGAMPKNFQFLPGADRLVCPAESAAYDGNLVIALDISDWGRFGDEMAALCQGKTIINIDHHISNDYFGDYNYVDGQAAATTEILTDFLHQGGFSFNAAIATALYTGLLTDSGNFTFSNTTAKTMSMAARLFLYEPDLDKIRDHLFGNVTLAKKKLLGHILLMSEQGMGGQWLCSTVSEDTQRRLGVGDGDFEGAIDHLMAVSGVKIAVIMREDEVEGVKVSLRAKPGYDVALVAGSFGGGGHRAAAGCTVNMPLNEVKTAILAAVETYLEGHP